MDAANEEDLFFERQQLEEEEREGADELAALLPAFEIGEILGLPSPVEDADVVLEDAFLAPGYGQMNPAAVGATKLAARCEGLILDPVYTAKAMAGFIDRARKSGPDSSLLFIHTGGAPAVFAYGDSLVDALEAG